MQKIGDILLLRNHEIDRAKWDACIGRADNGLIYARSFYLDTMSEHWDALVLGNYETVMPLTWNKKLTIRYLYQPPFTACLGIFGKDLNANVIDGFLAAIPVSFRFADIALNHANFSQTSAGMRTRNNFVLQLNQSYENLQAGYSENHRRNLAKSAQSRLHLTDVSLDVAISLNASTMKDRAPLPAGAYGRLKKLVNLAQEKNSVKIFGVRDENSAVLAAAVFLFDGRRAYYILAGNDPGGRNTGASHALVDGFIQQHAGQDLALDFEGSDVESIARFYKGFGAESEPYPALYYNRLPWPIRWMKPLKPDTFR
ncbi:MAG TPA: hypothetical protein VGC95_01040 [Chitinophagaceae bacterium]